MNTRLYFITDSSGYSEDEFLHRVEEALLGGATIVQLREKEKTTREYIELAEKYAFYSIECAKDNDARPISDINNELYDYVRGQLM